MEQSDTSTNERCLSFFAVCTRPYGKTVHQTCLHQAQSQMCLPELPRMLGLLPGTHRTLCPSGLRGWTQVPLAQAAWVQIPQVSLWKNELETCLDSSRDRCYVSRDGMFCYTSPCWLRSEGPLESDSSRPILRTPGNLWINPDEITCMSVAHLGHL